MIVGGFFMLQGGFRGDGTDFCCAFLRTLPEGSEKENRQP